MQSWVTLGQNPVDHQLIYQSWFALTSTLVHPNSTSVDNCLALNASTRAILKEWRLNSSIVLRAYGFWNHLNHI